LPAAGVAASPLAAASVGWPKACVEAGDIADGAAEAPPAVARTGNIDCIPLVAARGCLAGVGELS
jgi:hypothetical protein